MTHAVPTPLLRSLPFILPIAAIALARLLTHTAWAADNAGWAAILFGWVVFDALMLGLIAKSPANKPTVFQALSVLSLASIVVLVGAAAPVREIYLGLPQVLAAFAGTVVFFVGWSAFRFARAWRSAGSVGQAAETIVPPMLLNLALAELRVLHLALFRWNAPADVPPGAKAYSYHTYLVPMVAAILVLQVLEMSVVHLLLMFWAPTAAWVLLALSLWGVIWTIALIKSFRINPVLLTHDTIRARSGMMHDVAIPRELVADWQTSFTIEELKSRSILNLAMLSSPNVCLRFSEPLAIQTLFGRTRELTGVALRLEESGAFLADLQKSKGPGEAIP